MSNIQHRKPGSRRSSFAGSKDSWSFDVYDGVNDGVGIDSDGLRSLIDSWNGHYTLSRVRSVTVEGDQDTYDITIEGSHAFSVDGIQVHNSGVNAVRAGGVGVRVGPSTCGYKDLELLEKLQKLTTAYGDK